MRQRRGEQRMVRGRGGAAARAAGVASGVGSVIYFLKLICRGSWESEPPLQITFLAAAGQSPLQILISSDVLLEAVAQPSLKIVASRL